MGRLTIPGIGRKKGNGIVKCVAVYKCPLCGRLQQYGEPGEVPYDEFPALIAMVVKNQLFAGNPYLHDVPMHLPCQCPDGNAGLAQFAGFKRID